MLIPFFSSYLIGRLADQGLANLMGLETLRHGTNPLAWLGVHLCGTLPQLNKESVDDRLQPHEYKLWWGGTEQDSNNPVFLTLFHSMSRIMPRGDSYTKIYKGLKRWGYSKTSAALTASGVAFFVPSIRLRTSTEEAKKLLMPDSQTQCATKEWVSPIHFGTLGTLWNSLTLKTPWRIVQEPKRLLTGLFQITLAGGIIYATYARNPAYFASNKTALLAGAILGMI